MNVIHTLLGRLRCLHRLLPIHQSWCALIFLVAMSCAISAQARVVATQINAPADIGRGQVVDVSVDWVRNVTGSGDTITVVVPPQLTIDPPALTAGCTYTAPNLVCPVPNGTDGMSGQIIFQLAGAANGGFNLSATGTSGAAAIRSGTVRSTGEISIAKSKTVPLASPVAGQATTFRLEPNIVVGGDDVPADASIVVTDNLPGTVSDFTLTGYTFTGLTPVCNAVSAANSSRVLTCTYSGPFTIAQLNASHIDVTGNGLTNGSFTNTASIAPGNSNYFDINAGNNTSSVNYSVDPGTDIQALGIYPSAPRLTGSSQTLTLRFRNNGPLISPAGGVVETVVPAGFTIGTLPSGCVQSAGSLTVSGNTYNGTVISCTTNAVAVGAIADFNIPLTLPSVATVSEFPVVVTPSGGMGDANTGNNSVLLPFSVVDPYTVMNLSKSKTPGSGPIAPSTQITTTLTVRNHADSPSTASYSPAQPLRAVDYARPEEVAGGVVSNVSAGWSCSVNVGVTPPAGVNSAYTTQIVCVTTGSGTLAPGATQAVSFRTTSVASLTQPIELANTACTGASALTQLGLSTADGPQPPDNNVVGNSTDCASAGSGLIVTPVVTGNAQVSVRKESSIDNSNFHDAVADAPTLTSAQQTLYWRIVITTPTTAQNAQQEIIPTLRLVDNLPGILNVSGSGAPSYQTPAITVTTTRTGTSTGDCPNLAAGSSSLVCNFSNVPPGEQITVLIPVARPLVSGAQSNTATLTSPNALLSAMSGGALNDDAAINIQPRTDVALTSKTVAPASPSIGGQVQFSVTARNFGPDNIPAGMFTIRDTLNIGTPTLTVPAYEILSAKPSNPAVMSCTVVGGDIACTNTVSVPRYDTHTINIVARVKKPDGTLGAAEQVQYSGVTNTARVDLDPSLCEFREETNTSASPLSTACNDAASVSNNSKTISFDIKVPKFDLQQGKVRVLNAGQSNFLIGDQLRYRFSVRNAGPSRAENIVMNDILAVASGFQVAMVSGMPDKINQSPASSGFALVSKPVSCTQNTTNDNVVCRLSADPAQNYLDANEEVNFEIAMTMTGTAAGAVTFGNRAYVCVGDAASSIYESSGSCSSDPTVAGNNLSAVNDVVFPLAAISGFVYTERGALNSNYQPGTDLPFSGVTLTLTGTDELGQPVNLTTTTGADGGYSFQNLRPGTYQVVKTNPVRTPPVVNEVNGAFAGTDANGTVRGTRSGDETVTAITLLAGARVTQTNFAVTNGTNVELRLTKTGPPTLTLDGNAEYTLTITNNGQTATIGALKLIEHMPPGLSLNGSMSSTQGTISNVVTTGIVGTGLTITFDFLPTVPLASVNGTALIVVPVHVDTTTPVGVTTNYASVGGGGDIDPPTPGSSCTDPRCANVPSTVEGGGLLYIEKTSNKRDTEVGDMVTYTLTIKNTSAVAVVQPRIVDRLPQGFRLIDNTSRVTGANLVSLQGAPGPVITYALDIIPAKATVTIVYRVRVGVGSMQGDGVNRANAECPLNPTARCSNEARWRVKVSGGVFTSDACIVGMVYVDCNGNQIKDHEELGIPGVRLYAENGLFLISDSEGKYSYCGFSPKTHVLKVDQTTLPRGSRLVVSSNRNVGDANSLFLDLKNGELQRADFIEGSCSNTVLEQVKARRTQGEVTAPHIEKKKGVGFSFEGKAPNYPQQGTDSANQVIVNPRIDSEEKVRQQPVADTISERDTPLRQLEINQGGRDGR
ncbi:SdrD B-like domain-containing protein [uncultured Oxalicibacterium sp.]|uniref:SdrD B-like domain-containing protein n=1 Tax=uncultured Oxalicibacterium sp. TaxID=1168540 RepID=UPI0025CCEDBD|nr:SdrD B-like domain-containing protein [uncultured Oxalicibacterium sp.]